MKCIKRVRSWLGNGEHRLLISCSLDAADVCKYVHYGVVYYCLICINDYMCNETLFADK